jgi:hypothetical protein
MLPLSLAALKNILKNKENTMRYDTEKVRKAFTKCLYELRKETGHEENYIPLCELLALELEWRRAKNKADAKRRIKNYLGW